MSPRIPPSLDETDGVLPIETVIPGPGEPAISGTRADRGRLRWARTFIVWSVFGIVVSCVWVVAAGLMGLSTWNQAWWAGCFSGTGVMVALWRSNRFISKATGPEQ